MSISVRELAGKVGADFRGDGAVMVESAAPIETAGPGQIAFLSNPNYKKYLVTTEAAALVLAPDVPYDRGPSIIHKNPYLLFADIIDVLYPQPEINWGIHPTAMIDHSVALPQRIRLEPHVVVEARAQIGEGTVVKAGSFIGERATIGANCRIGPNVSIMHECKIGNNVIIHGGTVIGSDGFGFAPTDPGQEYRKIRQVGWVEVGDSVEIGANVTIDRGALDATRIGRGVKIDNLVMIAHNVQIGDNSIIVAQVGISGSTKLGRGVVLAGQVGLVGHIEVGDYAMVGAQSGVSHSLDGKQAYFGSPARPMAEARRILAALRYLPDLVRRVSALETKTGISEDQ